MADGRPRVLYTDPPWLASGDGADPALATVETEVLGPGVELAFGRREGGRYLLDVPDLAERARGAQVLVVYRCTVTPELLDAVGPSLRAVVRQGVGVDNLNAPLLAERGLPGYNVPDYCVDEVSAHTSALALSLERAVVPQHQGLTGGTFDIYAGGVPRRTNRRTLGVVGFGRIGRAVAARLGAFYGRVLVYDPYIGRDLPEGYGAQAVDDLDELLGQAHMVTLHCPLNDETRGMFDAAALSRMRPDAYLVNAARGALVDPEGLGKALEEGRIAGAGLDVFSPENPHDDPRWAPVLAHPRTVVTSHRAFLSEEAEDSSRRRVAEAVADALASRPIRVGRVLPDPEGAA
ncbi:C-terminal binding protein [Nocardiopsis sp. RSe5-2]|uniref:C-terminal binding protein n=1 Tax=Nocardiopsis endophytica TaxID=3018445 RepID=A0ABT4U9C0_9ACTN|nr:C-terminal binding protein [Nocardiopsis endophytica]MDA2813549.1 C-terminal binding protein [Nocardiopsis endophytica]